MSGKKIDKEQEEKKIEENKIDRLHYDKRTVSPTFGKFPAKMWWEYEKDCEENFNGTRWVKAWNDHIIAKQIKKEGQMWNFMNDKLEEVQEQNVVTETVDVDHVATIGCPTPKKNDKEGK